MICNLLVPLKTGLTDLYIELYVVKPAHAVTIFLFCHRTFHMNLASFKRSPVL